MATKVSTNNIFSSLQDDSDNEAPVKATTASKATNEQKNVQNVAQKNNNNNNSNNNNRDQRSRREGGDNREEKVSKDNHQRPKHDRDGPKTKGVPAEPHPQDRQSGTGISGVDKKHFRKDGGGRGNYGTLKGEIKSLEQGNAKVEQVEVEEVKPEEPVVVDLTITLEEYFKQQGYDNKPVEKAPERKLNLDELKRDKLQVVVSKNEKVIDAGIIKACQKKNKGPTTYSLGCNTENSELLGVKTGHTLVKYTVKQEGDELVGSVAEKRDNNDREAREPRGPREHREKKNTTTHTANTHTNKQKKVNVENESDFPKLG